MGVLLSKSLAPLFASAAVFCLLLALWRDRAVPLTPGPVVYALGALLAWALMSWFWSITPNETLKTGLGLAGTFLGAAVLFAIGARLGPREKRVFENGILLGGVIGFSLIAIEFSSNAWVSRTIFLNLASKKLLNVYGSYTNAVNSGMAATALFFWPWALVLLKRFSRPVASPAIIIASGLILLTDAQAIAIGFGVGGVIFLAALFWPRRVVWVLGAAIAVGVIVAPAVPGFLPNPLEMKTKRPWLSASAAHRIVIWKNTVGHIKQKLLIGSGFDTSRGLYDAGDKVEYSFPGRADGKKFQVFYEPIPLHPHNAILQVWLELGVVGALIGLVLLLSILRAIDHRLNAKPHRAAALGMVASGLVLASISFGIWQSWWLGSIMLSSAFLVSTLGPFGKEASGPPVEEIGGPKGPEPTRYGDWERKGRAVDF